jgi:hypothetical protein
VKILMGLRMKSRIATNHRKGKPRLLMSSQTHGMAKRRSLLLASANHLDPNLLTLPKPALPTWKWLTVEVQVQAPKLCRLGRA